MCFIFGFLRLTVLLSSVCASACNWERFLTDDDEDVSDQSTLYLWFV